MGRYTHKIAISNHRIINLDNDSITFSAKDYRKAGKKHLVTLSDAEFIRRFAIHVLPKGFTRIPHYGILSSSQKRTILTQLHKELGIVTIEHKNSLKHGICSCCQIGELVTIGLFDNRGPPQMIKHIDSNKLMALKK